MANLARLLREGLDDEAKRAAAAALVVDKERARAAFRQKVNEALAGDGLTVTACTFGWESGPHKTRACRVAASVFGGKVVLSAMVPLSQDFFAPSSVDEVVEALRSKKSALAEP